MTHSLFLKKIDSYFMLKPSSVGDPDIYLGAKVTKMYLSNGTWCWTLSPSKYVKEAMKNCEQVLKDLGGTYKLPKHAPNPFHMGYKPELDVSTPLEPELASYYQSVIGVMRWMCEIGRIDLALEVSMMSSHNAYPREGHFETVSHMPMGYLKVKHNSRFAMDPNYPKIDEESFKPRDWSQQYGDIKEAIPINAPATRVRR